MLRSLMNIRWLRLSMPNEEAYQIAVNQKGNLKTRVTFVCSYHSDLSNHSLSEFYGKIKPDTRFDTHCIKTGVRLWQRTIILIEGGACGVQRRKSWGASRRSVGCIFCFGVQIPGVMTFKRPMNDGADEDSVNSGTRLHRGLPWNQKASMSQLF